MGRRRRWGLVVFVALATAGCDWPMLGFGAARTGFDPATTISRDTVASGSLALDWTAHTDGTTDAPVAVGGVVYAGSAVTLTTHGKLYAFDAAGGSAHCAGSPKTCTPLWTATTDGAAHTPTVAGGTVYVGTDQGTLYAFDAAGGSATCTGTPKTCTPLWTASTGGRVVSPAVVNGVVYVGSADHRLYAFDAAGGSAHCSGVPKTCTPLWTATTGGPVSNPAVANGVVHVTAWEATASSGRLYAFDAAGGATCTGNPKTCTPLWSAPLAGFPTNPAVAGGVVYAGGRDETAGVGKVYAFDAHGTTNCAGAPKACTPLWTASTPGSPSDVAVAHGAVFVGDTGGGLYAFDAAGGGATCSGVPKTCTPLWTATVVPPEIGLAAGPPVVAGDVVYVPFIPGIEAFDADGNVNCSGLPKTCTSLWSVSPAGWPQGPAVTNGAFYVGTGKYGRPGFGDNTVQAYRPAKAPASTAIVVPANGAPRS